MLSLYFRTIEMDLDGDLHRGSRDKLLLSDRVLPLVRRVIKLEKDYGLTSNDAVMVVWKEIRDPCQKGTKSTAKVRASRAKATSQSPDEVVEVEVLRVKVSLLEKRVHELVLHLGIQTSDRMEPGRGSRKGRLGKIRKSRISEAEIVDAAKRMETRVSVNEITRKYGVCESTVLP